MLVYDGEASLELRPFHHQSRVYRIVEGKNKSAPRKAHYVLESGDCGKDTALVFVAIEVNDEARGVLGADSKGEEGDEAEKGHKGYAQECGKVAVPERDKVHPRLQVKGRDGGKMTRR